MCHPLPDSVPLELAALIEPLAIAWYTTNISKIANFSDHSVLILGSDPVGIALIFVLRARGAKQILVPEPMTLRAKQNAELAEAIFNPMKEKVGQKCRELQEKALI